MVSASAFASSVAGAKNTYFMSAVKLFHRLGAGRQNSSFFLSENMIVYPQSRLAGGALRGRHER